MGRLKLTYYEASLEAQKQAYYQGLPEKAKRHFLGQEYLTLGPGSQRYLASVFTCSRQTIRKGMLEVQQIDFAPTYVQQRMPGGGRKKKSA